MRNLRTPCVGHDIVVDALLSSFCARVAQQCRQKYISLLRRVCHALTAAWWSTYGVRELRHARRRADRMHI
eukprot:777135-Lingulodinium_polyedra.AAC.1